MRFLKHFSSYAGNLKLSGNSSKCLQTVFNISFLHDNEEISGDFLIHSPTKVSGAVLDEVNDSITNFVQRHGFNEKLYLDRVTGSSNFSAAIPNLSMERHKLLGNFVATHALVDDLFDLSPELSCPQHNIDMVYKMNLLLSEYFRCNALPIDSDIRVGYPIFNDFCRMYFEMGASLLECGRDLQYVYQGFDILVGGNVTQAKLERPKSKEEYLERKNNNFGTYFYFDLCCVLAGETLTHEVRESVLFRKFQSVLAKMVTLCLDPMTSFYDVSQGVKDDNYVFILRQQGVSTKDAVKATLLLHNRLFVEGLVLMSQLKEMNGISESDQRYLRSCFYTARAALEFTANNVLYNQNRNLTQKEIEDKDRVAKCVLDALHAMISI